MAVFILAGRCVSSDKPSVRSSWFRAAIRRADYSLQNTQGVRFPRSRAWLSPLLAVSLLHLLAAWRKERNSPPACQTANRCALFVLMVKAIKAELSKKCASCGRWLMFCFVLFMRNCCVQDLCICHLATNLLPGYNTLFLISIGSNRTRVERLVSLGQGRGAAWCQHLGEAVNKHRSGKKKTTHIRASEGFVHRILHKICAILTRPPRLSEHLFFEIGPPPLSCVMDEWLNCHKSGNQREPLKGFPSASSDHTSWSIMQSKFICTPHPLRWPIWAHASVQFVLKVPWATAGRLRDCSKGELSSEGYWERPVTHHYVQKKGDPVEMREESH